MKTSESQKEFTTAFCKFQLAIVDPAKDADNPFFKSKYVTLDNLLPPARKLLAECGLSITQEPTYDAETGVVAVTTRLDHTSGEWREYAPYTTPVVKRDAQGIGSAVTYARRYSLSAILGVAWEEDDDGNKACQNAPKAKTQQKPAGNATQKNTSQNKKPETVREYCDAITDWCKKHNYSGKDLIPLITKKRFNKERFGELTIAEAKAIYDNVESLVRDQQAEEDQAMFEAPKP